MAGGGGFPKQYVNILRLDLQIVLQYHRDCVDQRFLVLGFAPGQGIAQVKVNRLLLHNIDVRGVGWGMYAMVRPGYMQQQWARLLPLIESGAVKPPIGALYPLEEFGAALADLAQRRTMGKSVVVVRE